MADKAKERNGGLTVSAAKCVHLLMTVHNGEKYLARALDSVRKQRYQRWFLHIADDGSTDNSLEMCKNFAAGDARNRTTIIKLPHVGRAVALKALESQLPEKDAFVGWIDADDELHPDCLITSLKVAHENRGCSVYTMYEEIDADGEQKGIGRRSETPYDGHALLTNFMTFHFRLIPTRFYLGVGGVDETMLASEDFDLCLRLSEVIPFVHAPYVLYKYRKHAESFSAQHRGIQLSEAERAINRALHRRGLHKDYRVVKNAEGQFALGKLR